MVDILSHIIGEKFNKMATNSTDIQLITKYSEEGFDKVYKAEACSSVLSKDNKFLQFTGTKTVKIAKMEFGGLSNYERNNMGDPRVDYGNPGVVSPLENSFGYGPASAKLTWEERTIRMDRAAKYAIEYFDNEESAGLVVGNALTEINRTQIVPEVDAYCFSEIYKNAGNIDTDVETVTLATGVTVNAPLATLNKAFLYLDNNEVPAENQLIFISPNYLNALRNTPELTKFMQQGDYDKNVSFKMTQYEGRKLVVVPPQRFQTDYVFGERGFRPTANAKDIDFICMDINAATHVVKFQKTRILTGDVATAMSNMDGYVLLARIYHDLFVLDNKKVGIYVHTDYFAARDAQGAVTATVSSYKKLLVNLITNSSNKVLQEVAIPGDVLHYVVGIDASTTVTDGVTKVGAVAGTGVIAWSSCVLINTGSVLDTTAYKYYVLDGNTGTLSKAALLINGAAQA